MSSERDPNRAQRCVMTAKVVYLDSSDFSDLSKEHLSDRELAELAGLRAHHRDGAASFSLSAIHLSEAVHADRQYKEAACQRGRLMSELCDRRTLRIPNEVFSLELRKVTSGAQSGRLSADELYSAPTQWFGFDLENDLRRWRTQAEKHVEEAIAPLPRRERRKLKSDLRFSKRAGQDRWRQLVGSMPKGTPTEFPLNLLGQDFVLECICGLRSKEELDARLMQILSDPATMIEQVLDATDERHTIYGTLRTQGEEIRSSIESRLQDFFTGLSRVVDFANDNTISKVFKRSLPRTEIYRGVIEGYGNFSTSGFSDDQVERLALACPALSVFANLYLAYAFALFDSNRQRLKRGSTLISAGKQSDFGDLLHAAYAPYVDIFRCDAGFGALLKQDASVRAKIADRRSDISKMLQQPRPSAA